jgi:cystathionine gamma-synthase
MSQPPKHPQHPHPSHTATRAVRAGIASDRAHGAVVPPIHLTSTFAFESFGKPRTYDYTRSGNPTRSQLASAIAELEHGAGAVVTSTGMSAVTLVLHLVRPGDVVLAAHDCYGGTQRLRRALSAKGHFQLEFADLSDASALGLRLAACEKPPRIVWVETPSNPLLRITDIRRVVAAAQGTGSLVVVDNTFLSPALQQPLALGADLVVHSTTKYLNGHSDVVGGAVIARDNAIVEELGWWANCLGITGAPFDSFLTLRGIRTLFPRIRQHEENARALVSAIAEHPAVSRVYYPGLETHAGHEIARAQQSGFGAMLSIDLVGGTSSVEAFTSALEHFTLAESLGGVESLVAHPATMTHASMTAEARAAAGIPDSLVRLSVGIEYADDLVRDVTRALDAAASKLRHVQTPRVARGDTPRSNDRARRVKNDVVLLGVGAIGRELLTQVTAHRAPIRVCGLVDRSGWVFNADGLDADALAEIVRQKALGSRLSELGGISGTAADAFGAIADAELWRPILVDATAADTSSVLDSALSRGWDLVLANKVPLAADRASADRLQATARLHGRRVLHEATVGAGLPIIDTLRKLQEAGDTILSIEGCPSGTLGFLFGELGRGRRFSDALQQAVDAGYAEPDPRIDLSGLDVARKALILARLIGFKGDLRNIAIDSLVPRELETASVREFLEQAPAVDAEWSRRVASARERKAVLRYRARATPTGVSVGLVEVAESDPLGSLQGTDNQFAFVTQRYHTQPLIIRGPGAGPAVTAAGVFNDLLRLVEGPASGYLRAPRTGGDRDDVSKGEAGSWGPVGEQIPARVVVGRRSG